MFLLLKHEVGRYQTDWMDYGKGWLLEELGFIPICKSDCLQPGPVCVLASLFPHLSKEEVELDDFQGLFQLEHSILLYRTFYSIISVLL